MNTLNDSENNPANARLRELIEQAHLTQVEALALFNVGMVKPYSLSGWKSYLAEPSAKRWRRLDEALLAHAEKTIGRVIKRT